MHEDSLALAAFNAFRYALQTTSIPAVARAFGGKPSREGGFILYTFPDGTCLLTRGRGRSHQVHCF